MYSAETERITKYFIDMRYSLIPSYVAGGKRATEDGTPIVERCDLQWPQYTEAASSDQYILLRDILAAPINPFLHQNGTRSLWVPPGTWQDIWSGNSVTGPATISVTVPIDKMPLYNRVPSMLLTAPAAQNTASQDWSTLFLEVFPDPSKHPEQSKLVRSFTIDDDDGRDVTYTFTMEQPNDHTAVLRVTANRLSSSWTTRNHIVRLHGTGSVISRLGKPTYVTIDDVPIKDSSSIRRPESEPVLPFSAPPTAEIIIPPAQGPAVNSLERTVVMKW